MAGEIVLRYGDVVEIGSFATVTGIPGAIFALPPAANVISWQHLETGAPSAVSHTLQGSLDGVNFVLIDSDSAVGGAIKTVTFNAIRFIRVNLNSRTGGTLSRILVVIGK